MSPSDLDFIDQAEKAGFDLDLIDLNLSLTYEERIERHQSALSLVIQLETIRDGRNENS